MYSGFEKRYQSKNIIYQLEDEGIFHTDNHKLLDITEKYYSKLYEKSKTDIKKTRSTAK